MSGFYAGFNVAGNHEEIQRFKNIMFRTYDESKGGYGPFVHSNESVIIDFTAICPKLTAEREALERKYPGAVSPQYRGDDVDYLDCEDGWFWFQFTIDGGFPAALFEAIAVEFPTLVFSGSAYDDPTEPNVTEYVGTSMAIRRGAWARSIGGALIRMPKY